MSRNCCENDACAAAAANSGAIAHCNDCHNFLCIECAERGTVLRVAVDAPDGKRGSLSASICERCALVRAQAIKELREKIAYDEEMLTIVENKIDSLEEKLFRQQDERAQIEKSLIANREQLREALSIHM